MSHLPWRTSGLLKPLMFSGMLQQVHVLAMAIVGFGPKSSTKNVGPINPQDKNSSKLHTIDRKQLQKSHMKCVFFFWHTEKSKFFGLKTMGKQALTKGFRLIWYTELGFSACVHQVAQARRIKPRPWERQPRQRKIEKAPSRHSIPDQLEDKMGDKTREGGGGRSIPDQLEDKMGYKIGDKLGDKPREGGAASQTNWKTRWETSWETSPGRGTQHPRPAGRQDGIQDWRQAGRQAQGGGRSIPDNRWETSWETSPGRGTQHPRPTGRQDGRQAGRQAQGGGRSIPDQLEDKMGYKIGDKLGDKPREGGAASQTNWKTRWETSPGRGTQHPRPAGRQDAEQTQHPRPTGRQDWRQAGRQTQKKEKKHPRATGRQHGRQDRRQEKHNLAEADTAFETMWTH